MSRPPEDPYGPYSGPPASDRDYSQGQQYPPSGPYQSNGYQQGQPQPDYSQGGYQQGYPQQGGYQQGGHQQGYPQQGGYPPGGGYGYQPPPPPNGGITNRWWFWVTLAAVVVVIAGVVVGVLLSGGSDGKPQAGGTGGSTTSHSPSGFPTDSSSPGESSTGESSSPTVQSSGVDTTSGTIGTTMTLNGLNDGEKVAVTVVGVAQTARSTDDYDTPHAGMHYAGVDFKLDNIGSKTYDDAVDNCVAAYDNKGTKYEITIVEGISEGTVIDSVNIPPGSSDEGFSIFEVPNGRTITRVEYTPNSGYSDDTGTWKVG